MDNGRGSRVPVRIPPPVKPDGIKRPCPNGVGKRIYHRGEQTGGGWKCSRRILLSLRQFCYLGLALHRPARNNPNSAVRRRPPGMKSSSTVLASSSFQKAI